MSRVSHIYEINTRIWLRQLSDKHKRQIKLRDIPDEEIVRFKDFGFDCLWFMGVWLVSKEARNAAIKDAGLMNEFKSALPDLKLEDISSSPYAIAGYEVDNSLGNSRDIAELRGRLNKYGIKLLLDFVPNHVALDHPWLKEHPDYFIQGSEEDLKNSPQLFFRSPDQRYVFARGKDPYFPAWSDAAQLNYFNPQMQEAMRDVLLNIAGISDGVRCDMAMLILKRVQREIWGKRVFKEDRFKEPQGEFWQKAIEDLRKEYPDFIFVAEVYWNLENELLELGFDYVYDKPFYDCLRYSNIEKLKVCLSESQDSGNRKLRFIENHDEGRAASIFGRDKSKAAAFLAAIAPGAHLFHQGQLEGFKIKLPIQLLKAPKEQIDQGISAFYENLLLTLKDISLENSQWDLSAIFPAWKENMTYKNFIGLFNKIKDNYYLAVANYSDFRSQCYMYFDITAIQSKELVFKDMLSESEYARDREEIIVRGLYLDMPAYAIHLFKI